MAIDFPSSPTTGQTITVGSKTWVYDGAKWNSQLVPSVGPTGPQGPSANRNAIINGAFDIFQRSAAPTTGITTSGGFAYALDRWGSWAVGVGSSVVTSQQLTADTTNLPNIRFNARFRRATGNSDTTTIVFGQALENADSAQFVGKTVTLSFYARKGSGFSAASSIMRSVLTYGSGSNQPLYNVTTVAGSQNNTLTTTWQRFSLSATIPTSATQVSMQFEYNPVGTAGTDDFYEVTGVQLELGSTATTFQRNAPSIQAELAACQRYYVRFNAAAESAYAYYGTGHGWSTTNSNALVRLPVTMRTTPTSIEFATISTYRIYDGPNSITLTGLALDTTVSTRDMAMLNTTVSSGITTARAYSVTNNNSGSSYLGISAEL